ncbi:hypothetical protein BB560_006729 [Smittium megazygosporum]|uniref:Cytochrome P450 n=1 Tax=Smittium megazygosporum TaxID=133381 RepID=A0A2T9Y250_9FUNG|nr:hypothetical protein BB560_006729 [Smittium megazygosporum]
MVEIIKSELNVKGESKKIIEDTNALQIIRDEKAMDIIRDPEILTWLLIRIIKSFTAISSNRILNVIISLSSDIAVHQEIIDEQTKLYKKYGEIISYEIIYEMKKLICFVKESLLKSSPASYMHRRAQNDIYLSNGMHLLKGSIVSLDLFSHYHKKSLDDFEYEGSSGFNQSHSSRCRFTQTHHKIDYDDLVWGFGERRCPFSEYALAQVVTFTAVVIRKFFFYLDDKGYTSNHPGYQQISTVIPKENSVFLERYHMCI